MCGPKKTEEEKAAAVASKTLDTQLKAGRQQEAKDVKLLLLGAGESGKSTIFKQMKMIYSSGYTDEECMTYKPTVFNNTIISMQVLLQATKDLQNEIDPANKDAAQAIETLNPKAEIHEKEGEMIKALWADSGIQKTFGMRNKYQLNDSAQYYFDAIDRIMKADYKPTSQDVLRSRVATTGVVETAFLINEVKFRMFDVGGQRNERRKWIHCFDDVTAVLFVAALSEYDQVLYEDETQNRMEEALKLFDEICNNKYFTQTSMILFLNKRDIFQEKITRSPLENYFPDYTGGTNYDAACKFVASQFLERNDNPARTIYVHITCATDTSNIKYVFDAVKDIILQRNLSASGFV